ncbi:hypothetical protein [Myxosarcina sp. GI1(2024)]
MRRKSFKRQVIQKYQQAFEKTALAFDAANRDAITEVNYWAGFEGRRTVRSDGSLVIGANRNIVDTGSLKTSQKITIGNFSARLEWDGNGNTPAAEVYFGRRTEFGYVPGRDWISVALNNVDLGQMFKKNLESS